MNFLHILSLLIVPLAVAMERRTGARLLATGTELERTTNCLGTFFGGELIKT